jgi:GAF domain-containing protein
MTNSAFHDFQQRLSASGLRPALADLLQRTDYRFLAIFRFQEGRATAAAFVDRAHPEQAWTDEVPANATYCCYVRDARGAFTTADALADPRLVGHPARESVQAYHGVPIMTPEGEILGTLCHYDTQPRDPAQIDLELMVKVAAFLAREDHVPPYPDAATLQESRRGGAPPPAPAR